MKLREFQRRFIVRATSPGIDTAVLSLPRGNGKSTLAGHLISRIMDPDDKLFRRGTESVLCAASLEQARVPFRVARDLIGDDADYRWADSLTRVAVTHKPTRTVLRVISSNGKTALGLLGCPYALADEPGAWETVGGELMHDAIATAQGKPGSPLKAIYVGTLAPATGGWWHDLVDAGTTASTYVQALKGDRASWDKWQTIRKANPLTAISPEFRAKLLEERDAARGDTRLKARFLSYRLNLPTADESTVLLTVDDWQRVESREAGPREGKLIVALDLGAGRAFSAAVAVWQTGRIEAVALAPGIPSISEQEKRDRVPHGTYQRLVDTGSLRVAEGLNVQPPKQLMDFVTDEWGQPGLIVCDRFRLGDLKDAAKGIRVEPRVSRWSEASADIRALRRFALDGPLSCAPGSRDLIAASLSAAMVKNDDAGNVRQVKRGTHNQARDDVAAALVLGAGAASRYRLFESRPKRKRYAVVRAA